MTPGGTSLLMTSPQRHKRVGHYEVLMTRHNVPTRAVSVLWDSQSTTRIGNELNVEIEVLIE